MRSQLPGASATNDTTKQRPFAEVFAETIVDGCGAPEKGLVLSLTNRP